MVRRISVAERRARLATRHVLAGTHRTDDPAAIAASVVAIWLDGRIVGGWAQRKDDGRVVTRLLEAVPAARARRIEALAAGLQDVLGSVRITPRFPAALDRELRA